MTRIQAHITKAQEQIVIFQRIKGNSARWQRRGADMFELFHREGDRGAKRPGASAALSEPASEASIGVRSKYGAASED